MYVYASLTVSLALIFLVYTYPPCLSVKYWNWNWQKISRYFSACIMYKTRCVWEKHKNARNINEERANEKYKCVCVAV